MSIKGISTSNIEAKYITRLFIDESNDEEDEQPLCCSWFGCGKKLTLREQLCGKYCEEHLGKRPLDVTRVLKFK